MGPTSEGGERRGRKGGGKWRGETRLLFDTTLSPA